jgi:hypothetical protein
MRVSIRIVMCFLSGILLFSSCRRDQYRVNTSSIRLDIEVKRLEKDLFSPDPAEIPGMIPVLKEKYGSFLQMFSYVVNAGNINDFLFSDQLVRFCTDKLINEVYSSVMQAYPDTRVLKEELEEAFRHYLWYFPDKNVPAVFTCITGFNYSVITGGDSVLGIGLDRYLGSKSEYYAQLEIYNYIAARMNSWNIVPDCMYAWAKKGWEFDSLRYQADNVLAEMIHEGKLKYFEKCMLPEVNDTVIFGFTRDQMKFCRNNESQMWNYLIENDMLYNTDQFIIRKLTGEAPFTTYFTNESPGKAAVWLGFRIVESYMMKNKKVTLGELMNETNLQDILTKAKYRPE